VRDPESILDHLATAILVVDPRAHVVWLNAAAADLLATSHAAARGRRFASLVVAAGRSNRSWSEAASVRSRSRFAGSNSRPRRAALARVQGRRQEAARLIGWGRNTLTRKLRELGID